MSVFSARCFKKTDAARIAKLDRETFHDESWKPNYFGGQKVKLHESHKFGENMAGVGVALL